MELIKLLFKNRKNPPISNAFYGEQNYLKKHFHSIPKIDKNQRLESLNIVVIDTETTGFYSNLGDRVISIGAIIMENGKVNHTKTFYQLVNPERNIPKTITKLTSINNHMVTDKPTLIEILPHFFSWTDNYLIAGHIVKFDLSFINQCLFKDCQVKTSIEHIDTREIIYALFPHLINRSLEDICLYLGISCKNRHNALEDARMAAQILELCIVELAKKNVFTIEDLEIFIEKQNILNSKLLNHVY